MTGYLFVRHASADHVGRRLAGRSAGVRLNERGADEARGLAHALENVPLAAVYSSPLERALETAGTLASPHGLEPIAVGEFNEVDVGEWTDCTFEELAGRPEWRAWNAFRSVARAPGGESMPDVLARALTGVRRIRTRHEGEWVAIVSHCDVIRPLLTHFAGMPLDHLLRLQVDTASISTVELHSWGPRILGVNGRAAPHVFNRRD